MPEILTESFCERCGTRYTFESAAPRVRRIGKIRTLSKGLRNFVMSDGTTLDEALASARSETEREAVSQQLDAFHKAFHFCMTCRQYTCSNCWNAPEGRCLTCAPEVGADGMVVAPFVPAAEPGNGTVPALEVDGERAVAASPDEPTAAAVDLDAWPDAPQDAGWADAELQSDEIAQRLAMLSGPPDAASAEEFEQRPRMDLPDEGAETLELGDADDEPYELDADEFARRLALLTGAPADTFPVGADAQPAIDDEDASAIPTQDDGEALADAGVRPDAAWDEPPALGDADAEEAPEATDIRADAAWEEPPALGDADALGIDTPPVLADSDADTLLGADAAVSQAGPVAEVDAPTEELQVAEAERPAEVDAAAEEPAGAVEAGTAPEGGPEELAAEPAAAAHPEHESFAEPQPLVVAQSEPLPASEPELAGAAQAEPSRGTAPEPDVPTAEAEPEPFATTVAEAELEPDPYVTAEAEVEAEPDPYVTAEPEVEAEPELEPEPYVTAEAEPELEPEPYVTAEAEAEPEPEPFAAAEPEQDVAPEPSLFAAGAEPIEDQPEPSFAAELPAAESEPELEPEVAAEALAEPELGAWAETDREPDAEAVAASDADAVGPDAPAPRTERRDDAEPSARPALPAGRGALTRRMAAGMPVDERAAAAAAQTADLLARFRPGQSLDAALDAYEAGLADEPQQPPTAASDASLTAESSSEAVAPDASVSPVDGPAGHEPAAPTTEPAAVGEPPAATLEPALDTRAGEAQPRHEPTDRAIEGRPVESEPSPASAQPSDRAESSPPPWPVTPRPTSPATGPTVPDDRVETPVWRIVAPDSAAPSAPPPAPATQPQGGQPAASAEQGWPSTPQWPGQRDAAPDPLAFLKARDRTAEGLWAASNREVLSTPPAAPHVPPAAVHACVACGLSLSANARFCRRCGTRQA